jgi:hypothetical protein
MRQALAWGIAVGAAAIGLATGLSANAQTPYPPSAPPAATAMPPESAEPTVIAHCVCLHRDVGTLGADMAAKRRAYDELQHEIGAIDAELQSERATIDVNDPAAIARFRQQLAQRDALFQRSTGPVGSDLSSAVVRYNTAVGQYNAQCADRPRDPVLLSQVAAGLVCPAP